MEDKITFEKLQEVANQVKQPEGIVEIILVPNESIPKGRPVMLMHPEDYDRYVKNNAKVTFSGTDGKHRTA